MGNLLGAPVTDKETHVGSVPAAADSNNNNSNTNNSSNNTPFALRYGVSSMQGWRVHMEDAHITQGYLYAAEKKITSTPENGKEKYHKIDLPGHSLFAVFDGHGGTYAAVYSGNNLCRVLSRQPRFVQYAKFCQERQTKEATFLQQQGTAEQRTEYIRSGLKLLELSLQDAFVELDREIALALKGQKVPDADTPYNHYHSGDENNSNTHITNLAEGVVNATTDNTDDDDHMEGITQSESLSSPTDSALQLLEDEGDSGTTACVVLVTPEWILCANAGDSRSVLSRAGGKCIPLSYDHKPDDAPEERRIRASGGYVAGGRVEGDLAVSRGLGDFRFKVLDVVMRAEKATLDDNENNSNNGMDDTDNSAGSSISNRLQRRPVTKPGEQKVSPIPDILIHSRNNPSANKGSSLDEFILIACDGIWDVQTNYEAVKLVAELFAEGEDDLGMICEEVCDVCLQMGSKDNMTALVVQLPGQAVGSSRGGGGGGGVMARRQLRSQDDTNTNSPAGQQQSENQS